MDIQGKFCSFCGGDSATAESHYNIRRQEWISTTSCTNPSCLLYQQEMSIEDWNTLPDISSLLYQRDDAIGERNAYMKSYKEACRERSLLLINLNYALSTLKIIKGKKEPITLDEIIADDCIRVIADKVLEEINKVK
jgi:hypothetical protein